MATDCSENLLLLFEKLYCKDVDAFGIVTFNT
jgi:hypothetical protein